MVSECQGSVYPLVSFSFVYLPGFRYTVRAGHRRICWAGAQEMIVGWEGDKRDRSWALVNERHLDWVRRCAGTMPRSMLSQGTRGSLTIQCASFDYPMRIIGPNDAILYISPIPSQYLRLMAIQPISRLSMKAFKERPSQMIQIRSPHKYPFVAGEMFRTTNPCASWNVSWYVSLRRRLNEN